MSLMGSPQWGYSAGEDYTIDQSLRFEDRGDSGGSYLTWTPATSGNRQKWVYSLWHKRGNIERCFLLDATVSGGQAGSFSFGFNSDHKLFIADWHGTELTSKAVYRDPGAWMHILLAWDTTQATESNRVQIYVNGLLIALDEQSVGSGWSGYPPEDDERYVNLADYPHTISGPDPYASDRDYIDGYLAEVHFIDRGGSGSEWFTANDGTANSSFNINTFGEFGDYGEWKPKEVTGVAYGTNGFYLPFKADYEVEGFSVVTYKGTGASHYIGGVGFQPDLVWVKERNNAVSHRWFDSVRGPTNRIFSNNNGAESTHTTAVQSFVADGFLLGTGGAVNGASDTYVAWNWDMGDNSPTGFSAVTYKGGGAFTRVGGVGFKPDLVWIKDRDATESHSINDSVRGTQKRLKSEGTAAEDAGGITRFEPDGFTTSNGYGSDGDGSGHDFVAWCWNMGGTSVTNTSGDISSTVMANTTYGQSIVTYSGNGTAGQTVGHGLGTVPEMIIVKRRNGTDNWPVHHANAHASSPEDYHLYLDGTNAATDNNVQFHDTLPTSSVFTIGDNDQVNNASGTYVAYCFDSVAGYSKFGTYDGTGSTGNAVTTGFRPAFVMVKRIDAIEDWCIFDNTRSPMNPVKRRHRANTNNAEDVESGTNNTLNFTATGFTWLGTGGGTNNGSGTYIYMAFAGGSDAVSTVNTTGTIDSRVKANTTYGQSIVSYTGTGSAATIGHGLSGAPEMVIVKNRDAADEWNVYHANNTAAPETDRLYFSGEGATYDDATVWNDTAPTSTVFSVGTGNEVNTSTEKYIAYCFDSVAGYSKFGGYTGDGGSSHTITTGFKPALVIIKASATAARPWVMFDTMRSPGLVWNDYLQANENAAQTIDNANRKITVSDTGFTLGIDAWVNANTESFIYMAFADKREYAYWLDQSGNNNDLTSVNLTESDISVDTPTNNFCTWNPLTKGAYALSWSEGNLKVNSSADWSGTLGTFAVSSGKWYWEISEGDQTDAEQSVHIGIVVDDVEQDHQTFQALSGSVAYQANGNLRVDNSASGAGTYATYYLKDIIGVALDLDSGTNTVKFFKNNVLQGTTNLTANFTGKAVVPFVSAYQHYIMANFGQDSSFAGLKTAQGNQDGNDIGDFYYEPPTGYLALCTSNLPAVAVTPSEHFNTVLYTGTASSNAITGVGFQPDLLWAKSRSITASNALMDAVRGANKPMWSDVTNAEGTSSAGNDLGSFDADGFTLAGGSNQSNINASSATYVSWNWKAGTTTSGTTTGSGTGKSYSASYNTDAGFSIIAYTGNGTAGHTIPHHLGSKPQFIIVKQRSGTGSWVIYNEPLGATKYMYLNTTGAVATSHQLWNDTEPTSSVFTTYSNTETNGNDSTYVAYCFRSIDGFSKVGSYKANNNADGTFIYTGFRPAFLMLKQSDGGQDWGIYDNERYAPYNADAGVGLRPLDPSSSGAEPGAGAGREMDFYSNGFKLRTNNITFNTNNATYIYIAFAETPFKYANAR